MLRRFLAVAGAAAALALGDVVAAQADLGDPVNCLTDPTNPACVIAIGTPGGGSNGGGGDASGCLDWQGRVVPCFIAGKGWWGGDGCYYQRAAGDDLRLAELLGGVVVAPAYWYVGACGNPLTDFWPANLIRYSVYGADPGVEVVAREAVRRLVLPAPAIRASPDAGVSQVVFVPTWLWVEPGTFTSRSATASLAGLSVTAVATPTTVTWTTGDGTTVVCGGGTAWVAGGDPAAGSPDCGHTYTRSSRAEPGGMVTLRATVTWEVSWSGGGQAGTEPALTSTHSVPVRVVAAPVVNTR